MICFYYFKATLIVISFEIKKNEIIKMNHTSIMVVIKHYILIYLNILKFHVFKQKYLKLVFFL